MWGMHAPDCMPQGGTTTLHPQEAARVTDSGADPRVPPGYVEPDTGVTGVRGKWTLANTVTSVLTWLTDCVFKYSQMEIMARGRAAEKIQAQVRRSHDTSCPGG